MKSENRERGPAAAPCESGSKHVGEVRCRWAWPEPCVWTDRMLTALEKGVKGGGWYSLMDKAYTLDNLRSAFAKVKANKGGAGVDHQTADRFEEHLGDKTTDWRAVCGRTARTVRRGEGPGR